MKDYELTESEEKILNERELSDLPDGIWAYLGCINCAYRHTQDCPYYNTSTHISEYPESRICNLIKLRVLSMTPKYVKRPTYSRWQRDIVAKKATDLHFQEEATLSLERNKLNGMTLNNSEPKDIHKQEKKVNRLRDRYVQLLLKTGQLEDQQVHRETSKKVDITNTYRITPSDLGELFDKARKTIDITDDVKEVDCNEN